MAKNSGNGSAESATVATQDMTSAEIVRLISNEQLKGIQSFEDAIALAQEIYGELASSDELGNGFVMVEKETLLGVPFVVVDTSVKPSEKFKRDGQPSLWAIIRAVTKDHKKVIITDGSTGLCQQIIQWRTEKGKTGGFMAFHGLRKSEYEYTDEKGNTSPATTYYIDESGI